MTEPNKNTVEPGVGPRVVAREDQPIKCVDPFEIIKLRQVDLGMGVMTPDSSSVATTPPVDELAQMQAAIARRQQAMATKPAPAKPVYTIKSGVAASLAPAKSSLPERSAPAGVAPPVLTRCPTCFSELPPNAKFCNKCGTRI